MALLAEHEVAIQSAVDQINKRTAPGGRTADGHHLALIVKERHFGRDGHSGLLALQPYGEGHRAASFYVIETRLAQGPPTGSGCGLRGRAHTVTVGRDAGRQARLGVDQEASGGVSFQFVKHRRVAATGALHQIEHASSHDRRVVWVGANGPIGPPLCMAVPEDRAGDLGRFVFVDEAAGGGLLGG
ncbi:hypothetical protein [Streptomyces scabiei]|uniref:hypothetical protein n=1 Tax=Streptomyces scabiei TaxID=1930 RepID=UPI00131E8BB2|nr:hypothetical protein [Streptomyces scabiei]